VKTEKKAMNNQVVLYAMNNLFSSLRVYSKPFHNSISFVRIFSSFGDGLIVFNYLTLLFLIVGAMRGEGIVVLYS
jgi:hypothetical protein